MEQKSVKYDVWDRIDFAPAERSHLPVGLLPFLRKDSLILDVGCNSGDIALFLAEKEMRCKGIDINNLAVSEAISRAGMHPKGELVDFDRVDFLDFKSNVSYDAIIMSRFLTCIYEYHDWRAVLKITERSLTPGGIIYLHDFLYIPESEIYGPRYAAGASLGWRKGNFQVRDRNGEPLFIAHHHTTEEIDEIERQFVRLSFKTHNAQSMNGNPCRMFIWVGRNGSPS